MTKNKSKPLLILGVTLIMGTISYSQSIVMQSVNSNGTKMTKGNGSLSFTTGELVVSSQKDTQGNTLGGGFTSSSTLTTLSIQETDTAILDVKIFPNPSTELVNIQINNSKLDHFLVDITTMEGREVYQGKYTGILNVIGINTSNYAHGTYILTLRNTNNQLLGTYKIIKN